MREAILLQRVDVFMRDVAWVPGRPGQFLRSRGPIDCASESFRSLHFGDLRPFPRSSSSSLRVAMRQEPRSHRGRRRSVEIGGFRAVRELGRYALRATCGGVCLGTVGSGVVPHPHPNGWNLVKLEGSHHGCQLKLRCTPRELWLQRVWRLEDLSIPVSKSDMQTYANGWSPATIAVGCCWRDAA